MVTRDTPWPDGTPCWVDLMTSDADAAQRYYAELFGWQIEVGGPETGNYGMASIGGRNVAGIGQMQMEHPPVWTTYLATGDVEATCAAVEKAGGTVVSPAMDVMDFGRMAVVQDPSGSTFGLWQAGTHFGVALANVPNTLTWNELMTRDYEGAKKFLADVFGCTFTDMGGGQFDYSSIDIGGTAVGGIGAMPAEVPDTVPAHWRVYFDVEDADGAVDRVTSLGGTVVRPAADMPYGRNADVADPQGAVFSVIRSTPPQ